MKASTFQKKRLEEKKEMAIKLYKEGFSTRQVGRAMSMSHEWVAGLVREIDPKAKSKIVDKRP